MRILKNNVVISSSDLKIKKKKYNTITLAGRYIFEQIFVGKSIKCEVVGFVGHLQGENIEKIEEIMKNKIIKINNNKLSLKNDNNKDENNLLAKIELREMEVKKIHNYEIKNNNNSISVKIDTEYKGKNNTYFIIDLLMLGIKIKENDKNNIDIYPYNFVVFEEEYEKISVKSNITLNFEWEIYF